MKLINPKKLNLGVILKDIDKELIISEKPLEEIEDFYFFTGIGLRSDQVSHLGHYCLYLLYSKLSEKAPVVFQIANDEKRQEALLSYEKMEILTSKFKDFLGKFSWSKDFHLIDNRAFRDILQPLKDLLNSKINLRYTSTLLGDSIDLFRATSLGVQLAPILIYNLIWPEKTPVIISALDQAPYFYAMRDLAKKFNCKKPIFIAFKPLENLKMDGTKMASSDPKNCVNLQDLKKIMKARSDENFEKDFSYQLVNFLSKMTGKTNPEIEDLRLNYNPKESKAYKEKLIFLLDQISNKINTFEENLFKESILNFFKDSESLNQELGERLHEIYRLKLI